MSKAVAYVRVSSAVQVDGDGLARQREAIARRAASLGVQVVAEVADEGVSGSKALSDRPGLSGLLERVTSNGVRLVLVERADRLARDLIEGELILREFRDAGVRVMESEDGRDLTAGDDNPTAKLIRRVLGAVADFDKDTIVAKMWAGKEAVRAKTGRCGGRYPYGEDPRRPEEAGVVAAVRRLRRRSPKTGRRRSAKQIADELTRLGLPTRSGRPWSRHSVREIVKRLAP